MATIKTVWHTFPATPVRPAYQAMGVVQGFVVLPVCSFNGRNCFITGTNRVRVRKGFRFYNLHTVRFVDDGSFAYIPAAEFARRAKPPIT